jgi:hypothetical protein
MPQNDSANKHFLASKIAFPRYRDTIQFSHFPIHIRTCVRAYKTVVKSPQRLEILYARTKISRYLILIRTFVRAYKSA